MEPDSGSRNRGHRAAIEQSLFSRKDPQTGQLKEKYLAHGRVQERPPAESSGAHGESNSSKERFIVIARKVKDDSVVIHKTRQNSNGSFSIGKSWDMGDLMRVEDIDECGCNVGFQKTNYWKFDSPSEKQNFVQALIVLYQRYKGRPIPAIIGFNVPQTQQNERQPEAGTETPAIPTKVPRSREPSYRDKNYRENSSQSQAQRAREPTEYNRPSLPKQDSGSRSPSTGSVLRKTDERSQPRSSPQRTPPGPDAIRGSSSPSASTYSQPSSQRATTSGRPDSDTPSRHQGQRTNSTPRNGTPEVGSREGSPVVKPSMQVRTHSGNSSRPSFGRSEKSERQLEAALNKRDDELLNPKSRTTIANSGFQPARMRQKSIVDAMQDQSSRRARSTRKDSPQPTAPKVVSIPKKPQDSKQTRSDKEGEKGPIIAQIDHLLDGFNWSGASSANRLAEKLQAELTAREREIITIFSQADQDDMSRKMVAALEESVEEVTKMEKSMAYYLSILTNSRSEIGEAESRYIRQRTESRNQALLQKEVSHQSQLL